MFDSKMGMSADLVADVLRKTEVHKTKSIRTPFGRIMFTRDRGESTLMSNEVFMTNLTARKFDGDRKLVHEYDLGSGVVTNVGVLAMANDFAWAQPASTPTSTLGLSNYHGVGTGSSGTQFLVTLATPTTTNYTGAPSYVTGAQSLVAGGAGAQSYKTVATVAFTGSVAVTEWGLFNSATNSATTGTPFTATTGTTATATATPWTASTTSIVGTPQSKILKPGTTTVWGLVTSNTTSVATIANNGSTGWWTVAAGVAGSTPGGTEAFTILPVMWDSKTFSVINVVNGDSIQFTYTLLINSNG